jgi:ABC-type uncharacterized transport system substrate-binding protein
MQYHRKLQRLARRVGIGIVWALSCSVLTVISAEAARTVKVAVVQGGDYAVHTMMSGAILNELEHLLPDSINVITPADAYVNGGWKREACRQQIERLAARTDIDMALAFGPWVVEDLLEAGFSGPIVSAFRFDPVAEGLVDTVGRPIADNLTVNVFPERYLRDFITLRSLAPADTVAVICFESNDESERLMARMRRSVERFGIEVIPVRGYTPRGEFAFFKAWQQLPPGVDAVYLSPMWGVRADAIKQFLSMGVSERRPVFSTDGAYLVERGALVSDAGRTGMDEVVITAWKAKQIIEGARPSALPVAFRQTRGVIGKLTTAEACGVDVGGLAAWTAALGPEPVSSNFYDYSHALATAASRRDDATTPAGRIELELAVTDRYLDLLEAEQSIVAGRDGLRMLDWFVERTWGAAQVGLSAPEHASRLQAERAIVESELVSAFAARRAAVSHLAAELEFPPDYTLSIDTAIFSERIMAAAYSHMGDLLARDGSFQTMVSRLMGEVRVSKEQPKSGSGAGGGSLEVGNLLGRISGCLLAAVSLRAAEDHARVYVSYLMETPNVQVSEQVAAVRAVREAGHASLVNRISFFRACAELAAVAGWSMLDMHATPAAHLMRILLDDGSEES